MNKVEKISRTMRRIRVQIADCPFPIKDVWFNRMDNRVEFEVEATVDDFLGYMKGYPTVEMNFEDFTEVGCFVDGSWWFVRRKDEV